MMTYKAKKREKEDEENDEEFASETIEERVASFTRAVAPVLLPMISSHWRRH